MGDLVMIATVLAFFGACIGYVALCDRVIGPDEVIDDAEQRTADGGHGAGGHGAGGPRAGDLGAGDLVTADES